MSLQNNMPHAPIYWLQVQEHFNDIVVATYGRGFYILDDVTPLRALDEAVTPMRSCSSRVLRIVSSLFPVSKPVDLVVPVAVTSMGAIRPMERV